MQHFLLRQVNQIKQGGVSALYRKLNKIKPHLINFPLYISAIPLVALIRIIRPLVLIRWYAIVATRIGHFAANIELYACEKDHNINVPAQRHFDIFFVGHKPICNYQLFIMWKRVLRIWPHYFMYPVMIINKLIPGGECHEIKTSNHDRDVHNLFDKSSVHISFSDQEEIYGASELRKHGIPEGAKFVCLIVRDSAYLEELPYHSYRDGNIQQYVMACEELANRGYYVIRMGAKVKNSINSKHPKIIDYATSGSRSEFMDIYLGAKCSFCISTSTGFDSIPAIFRKPIAFVTVPFSYIFTFSSKYISITKHHISKEDGRELSFSEICSMKLDVALSSSDYHKKNIELVENSPEEIRDLVIEMADRLEGVWIEPTDDIKNRERFKYIFSRCQLSNKRHLHGEFYSHIGALFLKHNSHLLK